MLECREAVGLAPHQRHCKGQNMQRGRTATVSGTRVTRVLGSQAAKFKRRDATRAARIASHWEAEAGR